MRKLDLQNQFIASNKAVEHILKEYAISSFTFKIIDQGIENTSLYIKSEDIKYVLRIYRQYKKNNDEIIQELKFQKFLLKNGIPVPLVIPNKSGEELTVTEINGTQWQVILMEFVESDCNLPYTNEFLTKLAHLQGNMHNLGMVFAKEQDTSKQVLYELKEPLIDKIPENYVKDEKIQSFIRRAKDFNISLSEKLPSGYNHLDFVSGNVLVHNDKIASVIDFDDMAYSACVVCLGFTLYDILFVTKSMDMMNKYLNEYNVIRKLTKEESNALQRIILFRIYVMGIVMLTTEKDAKNLKTSLIIEEKINSFYSSM